MKWEYRTGPYISGEDAETFLNKMGNDGWELVSAVELYSAGVITFFFKRPKSESI